MKKFKIAFLDRDGVLNQKIEDMWVLKSILDGFLGLEKQ